MRFCPNTNCELFSFGSESAFAEATSFNASEGVESGGDDEEEEVTDTGTVVSIFASVAKGMKLGFCKAAVLSLLLLLLSQSSSALRFGTIEANLLALKPGKDNLLGASVVEE